MSDTQCIVSLLLIAGVATNLGCRAPEEAAAETVETAPPSTCVAVEPVAMATLHDEVGARANLLAHRASLVMSRSMGYVAEINVGEGDPVLGGETVLMSIRAQELDLGVGAAETGVEIARAGVNQAELGLGMARTDLERAASLHARGALTQEQLERAEARVEQLEQSVRQAEGQLRLARNAVRQARSFEGDTNVLAPISGVVARKLVEIGELVSAMPPTPLFQIIDATEIRVVANVPERQASRVQEGQPVVVELADGTHTAGELTHVAPALDPMSRTLEVWVVIDNADGTYRHGQSAWIRIDTGTAEHPFLPRHVIKRVEGDYGYLFSLSASGESVHERVVRLGALQDDGYPVLDGLEAGEKIIVHGFSTLAEGSLVRVAEDGSCEASGEEL